jgi:hypothetical protein
MSINAGDILLDNDPRMPQRRLRVVAVTDEFAYCTALHGGRQVRINLARIYTDGKPRRCGFTRVEEARTKGASE